MSIPEEKVNLCVCVRVRACVCACVHACVCVTTLNYKIYYLNESFGCALMYLVK